MVAHASRLCVKRAAIRLRHLQKTTEAGHSCLALSVVRLESRTSGRSGDLSPHSDHRGYNLRVGGFISFTDDVERIILRQFGNRLLWILVPVSLLAVLIFNQAQRAQTRWQTENLLAMLNFTLEITLAFAFIAIVAWEHRAASRTAAKPRNDLPGAPGYAYKFYIACVLVMLVITALHLGELGYFQYVHLFTVLQRGFIAWMSCAMLPAIYLLVNTRAARRHAQHRRCAAIASHSRRA